MEAEEPSLPPGYVSLAQLQERWLKKQQEKKLNEKREEERRNDGCGKMGVRSVGDAAVRNGGEKGVIDEKGKGKEIAMCGFQNGVGKKKNGRSRKPKSARDKGNGKDKIGIKELDGESGCNGVEVVGDEFKGIKEAASVCAVEVSPRHGVNGRTPEVKRMDSGGGFGRNSDNRGRIDKGKQSEGELGFWKKMEDEKGYSKKRRENRRKNGIYQGRYNRVKERRSDLSKGDKLEPESEKKAEDKILVVFSEKCGLSGGDTNRNTEKYKIEGDLIEGGEGLSDGRGALEKVDDEVLAVESAGNAEKGGVKKCGSSGGDSNGNTEKNKIKGDVVEVGEGLLDDKVALEKKVDDEVLVVESARNGEKGRVGTSHRRYGKWGRNGGDTNGNTERNKIKGDVVEVGKGLLDDKMALEKKVDDEVLVVESARNGEKGRVGTSYRRYGNWGRNGGEGRKLTKFERFNYRPKMERRGPMIWVKKEKKGGADAAEIGSSGISEDQEY